MTKTACFEALEDRTFMAAQLPAGFQETTFLGGLTAPTSMELGPGGRIFISEKGGAIKIYDDGVLTTALTLNVDTANDRGISGILVDPNFAQNGYVYVHYNTPDPNNPNQPTNNSKVRISRFTVNLATNTINANTQLILVDGVTSETGFHPGGAMEFGNDGKLYIGIGTPDKKPYAQDLNNLAGKVLRINPDGTIPQDNPFVGIAGDDRIWAYGFRNPFTSSKDPVTGKIYINDVGENSWEEINELKKGKNYGWNAVEGNTSNPAYENPVYAYDHSLHPNGEGAITGGTFYNGNAFPSQYNGMYFFADYDQSYLRMLNPTTGQVTLWGSGLFRPVDVDMAEDGNIYYLSVWGGDIRKISYVGQANRPPTAVASVDKNNGLSPLTVNFSGNGTTDPDGDALTYTWDLGNGQQITGKNTSFTYQANGTYTVKLTVNDGKGGLSTSAPITITVGNEAPVGTITTPQTGSFYAAGQTINFSGTGFDNQDGTLASSAFKWTLQFFHGTDAQGSPIVFDGVKQGSYQVPTIGNSDTAVFYRLYLTVTDSGGLQQTSYVDIQPQLSTLTLNTNIPGLKMNLDGAPKNSPFSFQTVVGMESLLGAPLLQTLNGKTYEFVSWSDGGSASHTIQAPGQATTYTAIYQEVPGMPIPGKIQAEDFDNGGQGVSYNDTTSTNQGGANYRNTAVDIEAIADDGGGYAVDYTKAGEWLQYTTYVGEAGTYDLDIRVANKYAGGVFRIEIDGVSLGNISVPSTGDWPNYTTIKRAGVNLTQGQHTMRVVMVTNANNGTGYVGNFNWFQFTKQASQNQAPSISIASPANNAQYNPGDVINFHALASDNDGTITKVQFYANNQLLKEDFGGSAYDVDWTPTTQGVYTLRAVAFDNTGATTEATITVNIVSPTQNQAPTVVIDSPADASTHPVNVPINVVATPSDPDGSVAKVEFYINGQLVKSDFGGGSYDHEWTPTSTGSYTVMAVVYDNEGATASDSVTVTISSVTQNESPSVVINGPAHNSSHDLGATINISATPSDNDGTITKVQFYANDQLLKEDFGPSLYDVDWTPTQAGTYTLKAIAYDNDGATSQQTITVTINPPTSGSPYGGTPWAIPGTIQAEDYNTGGQGIGYSDSDSTNDHGKYRSDAVDVNTTSDAGGGHAIVSTKQGEWLEYTINSQEGVYDLGVRVASALNGGAIRVLIDGVDVTGAWAVPNTGNTWTYQTITKNGINLTAGTHVVRLLMNTANSGGYIGNFNWLRFTRTGSSTPTNQAPNVSISSPASGSVFTAGNSVALKSSATDTDGTVTKVEYFNGTTKIGESTAGGEWTFNWTPAAGSYTITAVATDNLGLTKTSASISLTVNPVTPTNQAPNVSITSPANNATFTAGNTIALKSNATDSDGTVTKVEYFNGQTKIGESTAGGEWTFNWNNASAGTYTITAVATDNLGATKTSAAISLTVNPQQAPSQTPFSGTPIAAPGTIQAEDFDNGGEGVAYHDTDAVNDHGKYRTNVGVDVNTTSDAGGGHVIVSTKQGEWLEYTINSQEGVYDLGVRVASALNGGAIRVFIDGVDVTGAWAVPNTGNTWTYQTITKSGINLTAGTHVVRLYMDTANASNYVGNFNWLRFTRTGGSTPTNQTPNVSITSPANNATFTAGANVSLKSSATDTDGTVTKVEYFNGTTKLGESTAGGEWTFNWTNVSAGTYTITAVATDNLGGTKTSSAISITVNPQNPGGTQSPFSGTPIALPGTIQAEDFDNGGEGVAYHDNDAVNDNGKYRTNVGVDINTTSDVNGGHVLVNTRAGEWTEYTINSQAGAYDLEVRVASGLSGGSFRVFIDGVDVTGAWAVPNTGNTWTYQTLKKTGINLTAGTHVVRLYMDTANASNYVGNFNWLRFTKQAQPGTDIVWSSGTNSPVRRYEAPTVVIDGKVWAFGGWSEWDATAQVIRATQRVDVYDPATNTWTRKADLPSKLTHAGVAWDGGNNIYFLGGAVGDDPGAVTANVLRYSISQNQYFDAGFDLPRGLAAGAAHIIGNELHWIGGFEADRTTDTGSHYVMNLNNTAAGWQTKASLPNARHHFASIVMNGKIYVFGGQHNHDSDNVSQDNTAHVYDPATNGWTTLANLPFTISHAEPGTFIYNGKIVLAGGIDVNRIPLDTMVTYDPTTGQYGELDDLPRGFKAPIVQYASGKFVIIGGEASTGGTQNTTYTGVFA